MHKFRRIDEVVQRIGMANNNFNMMRCFATMENFEFAQTKPHSEKSKEKNMRTT